MKLNVDILNENLTKKIPLKQYGHSHKELRLMRPLLYDGKSVFKTDHVYITTIELLPEAPILENGTVIICKGKNLPQAYHSDYYVFLLANTEENIFSLFNIVQKVFDKYDEWDALLQQIVMEQGELSSMLDVSGDIFDNPMFILNKDLEIICNSAIYDDVLGLRRKLHGKSEASLRKNPFFENACRKQDIYIYKGIEYNIMCIPFFKENQFIGGIYIMEDIVRAFRTTDEELLLHLKTYADFLLNQYHEIISVNNNMKKRMFKEILEGTIFKNSKMLRKAKLNYNKNDRYICIKFKMEDTSKVIPAKLACQQIEDMLPSTIALVYQHTIIAFMNSNSSESNPINEGSKLIRFLQTMGYKAGLSEEFTDVLKARYYFLEACAAIDIGYRFNPELEVYYFKDYKKEYILSMISSEIPVEMLCEAGVLRLLEYDALHNTSYYIELRTYINCNMNAVQTAKKLYIHRNTLLTHLEHINRLTSIDLEDPGERMYIQLSYKLLESDGKDEHMQQEYPR